MRTEAQYLKLICYTPISYINVKEAIPDAPIGALTEALEHCIRMDEKTKYTKIAAELRRRYRESGDAEAAREIPKWENAKQTAHDSFEVLENAVTGSDQQTMRRAIADASVEDLARLEQEYDLEAMAETMQGTWGENLAVEVGRRVDAAKTEGGRLSPTAPSESQTSEQPNAPSPTPQAPSDFPLDRIDATATDLQIRTETDGDQIDNLRDALQAGAQLPPVDLYLSADGETAYIADGWHRYHAHREAKCKTIPAILHPGGKPAALKHALGANADHGLRRTNRDKRNAVKIALREFPKMSAREVAKTCAVTHPFVLKIQKEVVTVTTPDPSDPSHPSAPPPAQIDFWETFRADASEIITGFRARITEAQTLKRFEEEPERTAQELEALAETMANETREIRETVKKLREGIAKETK